MMPHRRPTFDPHGNDNALLGGNKLPRSSGGNIKDKISLWEGKEPVHSPVTSGSSGQCVKRTESLTKNNNKTTVEQHVEGCRRVAHKEKHDLEKENVGKLGDSRPCSPVETGKQQRGTLRASKPSENKSGDDCGRIATKEKQDHEKENVEKLHDSRPCSPEVMDKQQVGTLRRSSDKRTSEQPSQEKRAVFSLFKRLEAMGENHGKTLPELGNYFTPPSKDKHMEGKKKESESMGQSSTGKCSATRDKKLQQENVYTEPGTPPINPVPKPQRTFQHPATIHMGKNQRQRNLPPLPSISTRAASKPPLGVYGRPRGERVRDSINRYKEKERKNTFE